MQKAKQHLILHKGGEKFVYRYEPGQEKDLIDILTEHAEDKRTSFDWIDAAVLRLKLTYMLAEPKVGPPPISAGDRISPFWR
jgi:hypothetical protein